MVIKGEKSIYQIILYFDPNLFKELYQINKTKNEKEDIINVKILK